jgi:hypothetical protein
MSAYFGSKAASKLCQAIIALMPPHDTYTAIGIFDDLSIDFGKVVAAPS